MRPSEKSTTRREFVKDAALGVAGINILSSLARKSSAQETKHGHLIKNISYRKDGWKTVGPGNNDYIWWPKGKDLENKPVNFAYGFYSQTGDWGAKPHKHASDQFLVFVGLDNQKPDYLGAEVEVSLEDEKHVFSTPSCVIVPPGLQHGPIVTRKADQTYAFYMIRLDKGDASEINPA